MKTFLRSGLLGTVTLLVMALSARANLVTGTDPAFGANSLTIDTQTGLEWLDLGFTAGMSYNEVLADMQPGGMFSNYTFATSQQVDNLYNDAGVGNGGYYYVTAPAIGTLMSLLGPTETADGYPGFIAFSGTSNGGGAQAAPGILPVGINGNVFYEVTDGVTSGSSFGDSFSDPALADWLVQVPEPGIGSIGLVGLIGCGVVRRLKSQSGRP